MKNIWGYIVLISLYVASFFMGRKTGENNEKLKEAEKKVKTNEKANKIYNRVRSSREYLNRLRQKYSTKRK
jgi:hypothetical protein